MKRTIAPLVAALVTLLLVSSVAIAAPAAFKHATGAVYLANPTQSVSFAAFDYGATGDRGSVTYTNFEYPAPGSGAWLPDAGTYTLTTTVDGLPYYHTMTIDTVNIITPTNVTFSGTGFYNADPSYTWTITGSIVSGVVAFRILYTGTLAGYYFDGTGLAADMTGAATDSLLRQGMTWAISPAFAHEVLSYTAAVTCAVVTPATATTSGTATFGFTIPAGFPGLSGLAIVINVVDGGTPGTAGDTYGHAVGTCGDPTGNYVITSGNVVVH
jgi:hypothetical protein